MKLEEIIPGEKYWYKGIKYIALRSWGDYKIWPVDVYGDAIPVDKDVSDKMLHVGAGVISRDFFGRQVVNGKEVTYTDLMTEMGVWIHQITTYCQQAECHPADLIESHKKENPSK